MAMKLVERAKQNWQAARFSYRRASAYYDREEYGKALDHINTAIALYHKVPALPLGVYFLRSEIRHTIKFQLEMAHQRETFSMHRQQPISEGPI